MKATTLKQLKFIQNISNKDIQTKMNKATFYNVLNGDTTPTQKTIEKMCDLFKIDEKEFSRLLKNTLKSNNKK